MERWRTMGVYDQLCPSRWGGSAPIADLIEMAREAEEMLAPAGGHSIRRAHDMLADNFASAKADMDSARNRALMWVNKLADWPQFALQHAVNAWADQDTAYMPSIGQFQALGRDRIRQQRERLSDLKKILDAAESGDPHDADFAPDPEIAAKFRRLQLALSRGENIKALRAEGVL